MQIKDVIEQFTKIGLPLIGAALPIPGGAAIGAALAAHIGSPTSAPADILATITASSDARLKAEQFQLEHQERMLDLTQKHELATYQAEVDDRKSARQREVDAKDKTPARLAWTIIGGFIVVSAAQLVALMGWPQVAASIPPQGWLLIGNISGYLANEAKQAGAYYFGTTANSGRKDDTIAAIAKS